jgi:hypothetical protein
MENLTRPYSFDEWYQYLNYDLADKRAENFPTLSTPLWPISIVAVYFLLVFVWAPK